MPNLVLTGEICGVFSEIFGEYIPGDIESAMLLLIQAWISNHMPGKM